MPETSISLLTRDGSIRATFKPALNGDQYLALSEAAKAVGDSAAEVSEVLSNLGRSWRREVIIDPI